jgi:hypothetical protein
MAAANVGTRAVSDVLAEQETLADRIAAWLEANGTATAAPPRRRVRTG